MSSTSSGLCQSVHNSFDHLKAQYFRHFYYTAPVASMPEFYTLYSVVKVRICINHLLLLRMYLPHYMVTSFQVFGQSPPLSHPEFSSHRNTAHISTKPLRSPSPQESQQFVPCHRPSSVFQ